MKRMLLRSIYLLCARRLSKSALNLRFGKRKIVEQPVGVKYSWFVYSSIEKSARKFWSESGKIFEDNCNDAKDSLSSGLPPI